MLVLVVVVTTKGRNVLVPVALIPSAMPLRMSTMVMQSRVSVITHQTWQFCPMCTLWSHKHIHIHISQQTYTYKLQSNSKIKYNVLDNHSPQHHTWARSRSKVGIRRMTTGSGHGGETHHLPLRTSWTKTHLAFFGLHERTIVRSQEFSRGVGLSHPRAVAVKIVHWGKICRKCTENSKAHYYWP